MLVLVRMQFYNHVDTQPVKRFARAIWCIQCRISPTLAPQNASKGPSNGDL